ncbi:unnamed protein product [Calypogeia fissa]
MDQGLSAEEDLMARMKGLLAHPFSEAGVGRGGGGGGVLPSDDRLEQRSVDGASSSFSVDGLSSEVIGDGDLSYSTGDTLGHVQGEDGSSSSDGSSPLGWPLGRRERPSTETSPANSKLNNSDRDTFMWEEKREKRETELSEVEMMKERFAKLLLGEDMSGGGKGVCTALAISNAITNLSASVFGELWRLEPLAPERRTMWRREMEWLLSVSDHIVELVPSWQTFSDGSNLEVMVSRPRSDLHVNLPALRKLDTMLLDSLDSFTETDFWYVDRGIAVADKEGRNHRHPVQRQEEKWWLPTPKVPITGLSEESRKRLQYQRECTSQILKAAMAINGQVLSEMEVPEVYLESLPKNGKSSLGDMIYRNLISDHFSAEQVLSYVDLSTEHSTVDIANRIETAILVWRQKIKNKAAPHILNPKDHKFTAKASWGMVKDLVGDVDKRELLADRAESLLMLLKQRFPGLPQSALDTNKIQYNRDVGQSILESYSRVLESLAFNIIARIDDVLYTDDNARRSLAPLTPGRPHPVQQRRSSAPSTTPVSVKSVVTPYETPFSSPSRSPTLTINHTPNSPRSTNGDRSNTVPSLGRALTDYIGTDVEKSNNEGSRKSPLRETAKLWSYAGNLESSNALHSPPSRD